MVVQMRALFLVFLVSMSLSGANATVVHPQVLAWMGAMTVRQKIAQMCVIPVSSNTGAVSPNIVGELTGRQNFDDVIQQVGDLGVGGVICFKGDIASQVELLAELQTVSMQEHGIPLLVSQDAEWGSAMRLTDAPRLPKNMTLGAIQNKDLLRQFGRLVGMMCRSVGVHMNYAPVVDVNTNPDNPIIGMRAFHENAQEVVIDAARVIQGMLAENIMPCVKHVPGHGDSSKDSHTELPLIAHDTERLENVELYPYRALFSQFDHSVMGAMVAHLAVPALTKDMRPASLSASIVQTLLRNKLGFKGLIVTDALNMKAIKNYYTPREAAREAFRAGNDVLLFVEDVPGAIEEIEAVIEADPTYAATLDESVAKILEVKRKIIQDERIYPLAVTRESFQVPEILGLKKRLYEASITLVRDERGILPVRNPRSRIGYIKIGGEKDSLSLVAKQYPMITTRYLDLEASSQQVERVLTDMKNIDVLVVALGRVHEKQSPYGNVPEVSSGLVRTLGRIRKGAKPVVLSVLTSPYALKFFFNESACVEAYEDDPDAEIGALKVILGDMEAKGKLPIGLHQQMDLREILVN